MSEIRMKTIEGLKTGDSFTATRRFTEEDVITFSDISKDYNPIHFEERFVKTKGFDGRICHGLLVGSLITEIGGQIGWLASGMSFRFKRPVYFNDTITCTFTIIKIDHAGNAIANAEYKNQDGVVVMEANLSGIIPCGSDRDVLKAMVIEGDLTNKLC